MLRPVTSCLLFLLLYLDTEASLHAPSITIQAANQGQDLRLVCGNDTFRHDPASIQWVWHHSAAEKGHEHSKDDEGGKTIVTQTNGDLLLRDVRPEDARLYRCQDAESNQSLLAVSVRVRTPPGAVSNLSVRAHSVYAEVSWDRPEDGGFNLTNYVLAHRMDRSRLSEAEQRNVSWTSVEVSAESSSCTVFGLKPNATYYFRLYAINDLGNGNEVTVSALTKYEKAEVDAAAKEGRMAEQEEEGSYMKIWIVGLSVFIVTFAIIGFGISLLLIKDCDHARRRNSSCETTEEEAMELVPHITLNPSFNIDMLEYDEGSLGGANEASSGAAANGGLDTIDVHEDDEVLVRSPILRKKRKDDRGGGSGAMALLGGGGGNNSVRPNG